MAGLQPGLPAAKWLCDLEQAFHLSGPHILSATDSSPQAYSLLHQGGSHRTEHPSGLTAQQLAVPSWPRGAGGAGPAALRGTGHSPPWATS